MIKNLYKILPIEKVNPAWFGIVIEKKLEDCRKSIDGTKIVLKIPIRIQNIDDVPNIWKKDFINNQPYMNHEEILAELQKPEWNPPNIFPV